MLIEIKQYLEEAMSFYTKSEELYSILLKAKEEYFAITGVIHEESDEYEMKMNSFNDWFLLHFSLDSDHTTVICDYLKKRGIKEEIIKIFKTPNYSLFHYKKVNSKNQVVLKDILHDKTITVTEMTVGLIEKDLFIGRTLQVDDQTFLMRGICVLPQEIESLCTKQSKKVRKLHNPAEETSFLLTLEFMKTKWLRYGRHIDSFKIFIFS